jgi:heme/copper-type cytochrome/quinol oxidase subunit 2
MQKQLARDREFTAIAILVIVGIVLSGLLGFYISTLGGGHGKTTTTVTATGNTSSSSTTSPATSGSTTNTTKSNTSSTIANLVVVPDFGGSGVDAFVLASNLASGTVPSPATNTAAPGPNDNNITIAAGTTVTFVLTSIDTAVNQNFSGTVPTPFTVYNDTSNGVIASNYTKGQSLFMQMGHTFTINSMGVSVPIPPDTIVKFNLTFSKAGTYEYVCLTPCGAGMGVNGYMQGYVIVTS